MWWPAGSQGEVFGGSFPTYQKSRVFMGHKSLPNGKLSLLTWSSTGRTHYCCRKRQEGIESNSFGRRNAPLVKKKKLLFFGVEFQFSWIVKPSAEVLFSRIGPRWRAPSSKSAVWGNSTDDDQHHRSRCVGLLLGSRVHSSLAPRSFAFSFLSLLIPSTNVKSTCDELGYQAPESHAFALIIKNVPKNDLMCI